MTDQFPNFAKAIKANLESMSAGDLYTVGVERDTVWALYLDSFPAGSNSIFRERTEHDCSCCKNFVRNIGVVVSLVGGKVRTVWDAENLPEPYQTVANRMSAMIRASSIQNVFRVSEPSYGAETTKSLEDGKVYTWHHFVGNVAKRFQTNKVAEELGGYATGVGVFSRGLTELTVEALNTTVELIESNQLYRGQEFLRAVTAFRTMSIAYRALKTEKARELFVWENIGNPIAAFRNTVIGTLVVDLSVDMPLERAIAVFEAKVAPQNYKRPVAAVTPRMIDEAVATITELGLDSAVRRRFAKLTDISVHDVLFVDNDVKKQMKGGLTALLLEEVKAPKAAPGDPVKIPVADFVKSVVPKINMMSVLVHNNQLNNFVSITAPAEVDTGQLLKWRNDFAWSYDGAVADSIKERVKKAGGNVTNAQLRISLAWFNRDDLDLHVKEPHGKHISFMNKEGKLDVDMNIGGERRDAVENISYKKGQPIDGVYQVIVNNFRLRERIDTGFSLEIENEGQVQSYHYDGVVGAMLRAIDLEVKGGRVVKTTLIAKGLVGEAKSVTKWGVPTESWVKVATMMKSPNHWEGAGEVGNRHWIFAIDGCKNPEPTRGFYNEFLNARLEKHRKVFEILGEKTKCEPAAEQVSGVGFSEGRGDSVIVLVAGAKLQSTYEIQF